MSIQREQMETGENVFVTQKGRVGDGRTNGSGSGGAREALIRKREQTLVEEEQMEQRKTLLRERAQKCIEIEQRLKERAIDMEKRRLLFAKMEEECKQKMNAASSRLNEEHSVVVSLENESKEKAELSARLEEQRKATSELVESLAWCQRFLQRVVESSDEFPTVSEVLSRHDTLTKAHKVSESQQRRQKEEVERLKADTDRISKQHRDQVFLLESELAAKKKELEEERERTEELVSAIASESESSVERMRHQGELVMGIKNMCARIEAASGMQKQQQKHDESNVSIVTRLARLGDRLSDLHDVVNGYDQQHQGEKPNDENKT